MVAAWGLRISGQKYSRLTIVGIFNSRIDIADTLGMLFTMDLSSEASAALIPAAPVVGVVGAASLPGAFAAQILHDSNLSVARFSRKEREGRWFRLTDAPTQQIRAWIDFGHIWTFDERRDAIKARGAEKIVIVSSTSRFTKSLVGSGKENDIARKMADGEDRFSAWCEANNIEWVILRPTLIYGLGKDKNISEIARMIRRFGLFPIFGAGKGKRQPVHAYDVANACAQALRSSARNKSYNISGGEVLPYREMVKRIFIALGMTPRMPTVPLPVFRAALMVLNRIPRFSHWSPQMAERMNLDMAFDNSEARQDFGFDPQAFDLSVEDVTLS